MKYRDVQEKKKMSAKDDPCWKGYHMVGTKMKDGREVPNCVPGRKGVNESAEEVKQAIAGRIMRQHLDLVSKVGPQAIIDAIEEVGDSVGDVEEIGTSDVSAWVNTVKQYLTRRMTGEGRTMEGHDQSHGSPYDRGSADSWYSRPRRPHKGGVGGDSGPEITDLTPDEIKAYHAGYDENEKSGGKKSWESVELEEDWRKALASLAVAGTVALGALTPSHAADAPQAPTAATQVAPDSANPADAAKMKLNVRPSLKKQVAGDDTVSPDDAAQTQLKLRPSIKRPAAEATDTTIKPADKTQDGYIRMLMYKLKNDRPLSRREREDLEQHLKIMGLRIKEGKMKCESLRNGEYHLATVTLDNGETRKVKVFHDEGVGEYIKKFFARQGHQVVDYKVDYSIRTEAMKLSDLPPAMRRKLTMKDVEAERPKGAFRYRVGDKEFMSKSAADSHAYGTGEKVEPIYNDDVEERKLTAHEKERREEIVKGMKKAKGDFEKRYGDQAKSVMYATATKIAKNEDINESKRLAADEGHYYCEAEHAVKPIPEGYVKVAGGYIMKKI